MNSEFKKKSVRLAMIVIQNSLQESKSEGKQQWSGNYFMPCCWIAEEPYLYFWSEESFQNNYLVSKLLCTSKQKLQTDGKYEQHPENNFI